MTPRPIKETPVPDPESLRALIDDVPTPDAEEQVPGDAGARLSRCDTCGAVDNHPMVVVIRQFGNPAAGTADVVEEHHNDCYALSTGDPHSVAVVEQSGGLKGHDLRVFIAESFDPTLVQEA